MLVQDALQDSGLSEPNNQILVCVQCTTDLPVCAVTVIWRGSSNRFINIGIQWICDWSFCIWNRYLYTASVNSSKINKLPLLCKILVSFFQFGPIFKNCTPHYLVNIVNYKMILVTVCTSYIEPIYLPVFPLRPYVAKLAQHFEKLAQQILWEWVKKMLFLDN